MRLECEYSEKTWEDYPNKFYRCYVGGKQIVDNEEIEFIGIHQNCKTNNDVTHIWFSSCTMNKLPKNLSKVFPNLNIISVGSSKLKTICKNDLSGFKQLKIFRCSENEIEFVPGDLFEDSKCIEWIRFYWNKKLKVIEPNLLDKLEHLKYVDLRKNLNHNIEFSVWDAAKSTLEEVKIHLAEKYFVSPEFKDLFNKQENPLNILNKYIKSTKSTGVKVRILEIKSQITEDNFQSIQKGLLGDLKRFLQNENIKDFKIIIGTKEFMVHKFLLAARCPTFSETFSNNPTADSLKLIDISEEVFEKILKFLYTDELPGDVGTNFVHLFGAAGRLQIIELKNFAVKKILKNIGNLNALELLHMANKYKNEELIKTAFEEVKKRHPKIDFKDEWAQESERVAKLIEALRKKEEAIKKAESEFENLMI